MDPHAFVAEVYRRMSLRHSGPNQAVAWQSAETDSRVAEAAREMAGLLPAEKAAAILDIGFGRGWFLAACLKLGYRNLAGADFGISNKGFVREWAPEAITLHEITTNIGDFLADQPERYDFIHLSHVIEHIPKYSLFWVVDAIYRALRPGGTVMLRTPNMEGPFANSSLYVTLAHEYGFSSSNLASLLDICGFDEVRFHAAGSATVRQKLGRIVRWPFLKQSQLKHRLFGVGEGRQFGSELVVTARRGTFPPYFDPKYR